MIILKATHLGMCFGVRDAIELALKESRAEKVSILGELVHNEQVNKMLTASGVQIHHNLDNLPSKRVIITAHGASEKRINHVRRAGLNVVEATCPLVHHAHQTIMNLAKNGYFPVVIGRKDHVEVKGLTEDLTDYRVILTEEDLSDLPEQTRFGVISQTTQPIDRVKSLVEKIRTRFKDSEVLFKDTVCQPTKDRQNAAIQLAKECDLVIVIGGRNSNNSRELVATCSRYCNQVVQVESVAELKSQWFYNLEKVGITAGTSTPDSIIEDVEKWLMLLKGKNNVITKSNL